MNYLTAKQFAEKWGISERRIIKLCKEDRISGAIKNGMVWSIPEDTMKPSDKRSKISKYINTEKRVVIVNANNFIGYNLMPLLKKDGYIVEGICNESIDVDEAKVEDIKIWKSNFSKEQLKSIFTQTEKYYDGLIIVDTENIIDVKIKELLINEFSKKMNCESSIVLVNDLQNSETKLEKKFANDLNENIGIRINSINMAMSNSKKVLVNYDEIAEDILELLTKFRNTTGTAITTDGGAIEFDTEGRTAPLETGKFYRVLNSYFKRLNKESHLWCASTMLEDEWTEEPLEMNFRVINLEVANRGTKFERIFIFSKNKIKEFKNNKTLKIYMQSNINTMFVDYDEIKLKEPKLLEIVGDGWDGIDNSTLIADLPEGSKERGYVSINKKEVQKAFDCFQTLKTYAKDLREVLK